MNSRGVALVLISLGTAGFLACGSRTGLPFDEAFLDSDAGPDGRPLRDGNFDGFNDEDALPPLDGSRRDAQRMDCLDAGDTQIYVVTLDNELLAFYPPQGTFKRIGTLACPTPPFENPPSTPFSMAVDRRGVAYVLFSPDGRLYRVSTSTAACVATPYRPGQQGFQTFGMGFSTNMAGPTETLFVAQDTMGGVGASLGSIDLGTFGLRRLGTFNPQILQAELTGTGDGRLFAFYAPGPMAPDSFVGELDKTNANIIAADRLNVAQGRGWAFGFWGGDFYLFTAPTNSSVVTRFRPSDKSVTVVGSYPGVIVGAGVSTCAPQ